MEYEPIVSFLWGEVLRFNGIVWFRKEVDLPPGWTWKGN
jgi:hypothetical protein